MQERSSHEAEVCLHLNNLILLAYDMIGDHSFVISESMVNQRFCA
jgi:hypothetical protein